MKSIILRWRDSRGVITGIAVAVWLYLPVTAALIAATAIDDSMINGERAWLKPLKFSISIGLNGAAALWLLRRLPPSRAAVISSVAIAVGLFGEQALITVQAARGVTSHFNTDTGFDSAVFSSMGVLIAVVWFSTLTLALVATRSRSLDEPVRAVAVAGSWLVVLGSSIGFIMIAAGRHSIGTLDANPDRLPIVGWNATDGDLRPAHFVGLHGLQALIVTAWLYRHHVNCAFVVVTGAAAVAVTCIGLTVQALAGAPVASTSSIAIAAAAAVVPASTMLVRRQLVAP